jgi:hypothetical protein
VTYPIRQPPDLDTAWGGDVRAAIGGVNNHQTRVTALENGSGRNIVTVTYAASVTLNATQGALFWVTATGDLIVSDITGGVDGQGITLHVLASGGTRSITVGGVADSVPSGTWWVGRFTYHAASSTWIYG